MEEERKEVGEDLRMAKGSRRRTLSVRTERRTLELQTEDKKEETNGSKTRRVETMNGKKAKGEEVNKKQ